jgi:hypothetical protein
MGLTAGLARERLVEPRAMPDHLLGDTLAIIYRGLLAKPGHEAR